MSVIHPVPVLGAILTLALATMTASPASARIVEHLHDSGTETHIEQEAHGEDFCPDIPFPVLFSGEFSEHLMVRTLGQGELEYFSQNFRSQDTYTNVESGRSITILVVSRNGDHKVIDNGDGTLTILISSTGRTRLIGPDGETVFQETGQFKARLVIDANGTPGDPSDDVELSFEVLSDTGHNGSEGHDFCEDLATFLG